MASKHIKLDALNIISCVSPNYLNWICFLFFVACFCLLLHEFRKQKTKILFALVCVLFVLGVVLDMIPNLDNISSNNWWPSIAKSVIASVEMFFSETKFTELLLEEETRVWYLNNKIWYLPIYYSVYCCALATSIYFVIDLLLRVFSNKWWLFWHGRRIKRKELNVFFCLQPQCRFLAQDILDKSKETNKSKYDILDKFKGIFSRKHVLFINPTSNTEEKRFFVSLLKGNCQKSDKMLQVGDGKKSRVFVVSDYFLSKDDNADLFSAMGLSRLKPVVHNPNASLYLISDNEEDNIRILNGIRNYQDVNCEIFCHARHESLVKRFMDNAMGANLHFVDTSILAVHEIKKSVKYQPIHPVNFVEKEVEDVDGDKKNNRLTGRVSSPFNALVLGFGGCGQEMLGFLYEYGSFVGKNNNRSLWHAVVYDEKIDEREGAFLCRCPEFHSELVDFRSGSIGTASFWKELKNCIGSVNYVVVALGNDDLNLGVGLDVLQLAYNERKGKLDNFVIMVHYRRNDGYDGKDSCSKKTLDHYNRIYGEKVHLFGNYEAIWKCNVISDKDIDQEVKEYFDAYSGDDAAKTQVKIQDQANYFHAYTKYRLCPEEFLGLAELIKRNSDSNNETNSDMAYRAADNGKEGSHVCKGCNPEAEKVFENLAITEHLRWVALEELLGFRPAKTKDAEKKLHNCMIPYDELNTVDEARNEKNVGMTKHYDWLPVRMSLMKYAKRPQK